MNIDRTELSNRSKNALQRMGIHTVEDLLKTSPEWIMKQRGIGANSLKEIVTFINDANNETCTNDFDIENTSFVNEPSKQGDMFLDSVQSLSLSSRADRALHKLGIEYVYQILGVTSDSLSKINTIGKKTIAEIMSIKDELSKNPSSSRYLGMSNQQVNHHEYSTSFLNKLSLYTISDLNLSIRAFNCLKKAGINTLAQLISLNDSDINAIRNLGKESKKEIKESLERWMNEANFTYSEMYEEYTNTENRHLYEELQRLLSPICNLSVDELARIFLIEQIDLREEETISSSIIDSLFQNEDFIDSYKYSLLRMSNGGIIQKKLFFDKLDVFGLDIFTSIISNSIKNKLIISIGDYYVVNKKRVLEYLNDSSIDDKKREMIIIRLQDNKTLQETANVFGISRERVRQVVSNFVKQFDDCFENYFNPIYTYFGITEKEFCEVFPEAGIVGFNYLSLKYHHGYRELCKENLSDYNGPFEDLLLDFCNKKEKQLLISGATKTDILYRVLLNSDAPLSLDEFEKKYTEYLIDNGYDSKKLAINIRTAVNHARNADNIVFNKENKLRYLKIDSAELIKKIHFNIYNNQIISSELIYRNNIELMDDFDIRDGYELFYVLKSKKNLINERYQISFRRVPTLIIGDGSEEKQVIKLMRELSPVSSFELFKAYEERYGTRMNSAQANLSKYIAGYLINGTYHYNVKTISRDDESMLLSELSKKNIWFMEELEELFKKVCLHSSQDSLNAAAMQRIGYKLYPAGYALSMQYDSVFDYFKKEIFNSGFVDLSHVDSRIFNLSMYGSFIERIRQDMSYIEVKPKLYMSLNKINEIYGISKEDILQIQKLSSELVDQEYFNGHSIWNKCLKQEEGNEQLKAYLDKLKENRWFLTSILKLQTDVYALRMAGNTILSYDNENMNLVDVCLWIVAKNGKQTINELIKILFDYFGVRVNKERVVSKIRERGCWNDIITDSVDEFINSVIENIDLTENEEDFFAEEFY